MGDRKPASTTKGWQAGGSSPGCGLGIRGWAGGPSDCLRMAIWLLPLFGCRTDPGDIEDSAAEVRLEGAEPGDCTDRADNDEDGLFDCDDDGCLGSPDCADSGDADTDADADSDTDSDADTDTDSDADPLCSVAADGSATYTDIQLAVDEASDGETVYVCPGTYSHVQIDRRDVSIEGVDGAEATIIEGGSHPAITLDNVTSTVRGFTLTGDAGSTYAAAILTTDATVTVVDTVISDCTSSLSGTAAVIQTNGDTVWENVEFRNNVIGVFSAAGSGSVTMEHALVVGNSGGSLWYTAGVDLSLTNSIFRDNTCMQGTMFTALAPGVAWNNTFYNNTAPNSGVAIVVGVDFQNNITQGLSGYVATGETADYNDYFDNGPDDDHSSEAHSLTVDAHFTDAGSGDLTLDVGFSECIDAGNPLSGYNDADGTRNDMGAFGGAGSEW